jgi:hypothetical protein
MRSRNRCIVVIVFLLAIASLTVRTTAARIVEPLPMPEAIDPGDPDNPSGGSRSYLVPPSSGKLAHCKGCQSLLGASRDSLPDVSSAPPARAHRGDWRFMDILLFVLFQSPVRR